MYISNPKGVDEPFGGSKYTIYRNISYYNFLFINLILFNINIYLN